MNSSWLRNPWIISDRKVFDASSSCNIYSGREWNDPIRLCVWMSSSQTESVKITSGCYKIRKKIHLEQVLQSTMEFEFHEVLQQEFCTAICPLQKFQVSNFCNSQEQKIKLSKIIFAIHKRKFYTCCDWIKCIKQ